MKLSIAIILLSLTFHTGIAQSLSVSISSQTNVAINGQSTGAVTVLGSGGTAPYQYSKDGITFQSSATFSALAAGNYVFTIRDAALATATVNATITQASTLVLSVNSQTNVNVIGQATGSVTLAAAGGTAPYQFSKNGINYQTSATFGSLTAGNYTFTVRDASLNTASVNLTITQSNVLTVYLTTQTNIAVIGQNTGSVTLAGAGGTPPYLFSKDGISYQTSATFGGLAAGIYTFTIRDAAFNSSSLTATITQPAPLALSVTTKTNIGINGQSTGSVTLSASGGTPPYEYSKDGTTYQSVNTFSALPAGSYTFSVRDAASGTSSVNLSLTEPPVLVLALGSKTDVDAYGQSTGLVSLTGSGGVPPYQYSKDGTSFQATPDFTELRAGTYTFTLRDAASATATTTVAISEPAFDVAGVKAMNNFSPNGDGINDLWEVEGITTLPEHSLTVFDRGGRVLLKVRNYKNDWNGTINGSALAEGTYYYAISFDAPVAGIKKGFITLIK
ncbi:gliding motility-associated C-terminal domain-containing protein [Paradesertivirga mongoliensis]|uniref:Gliding motility-associated C-terminal domain-containing protein n=1 Tax=Paradesertivirga mongoliensis TaxID=2100740 RepID=A0ABW4ZNY2_9SPHI|nr:gliding motility-associated C-terminal domain-containing protein [Pedobacter mongoliensis]